MRQDDRGITLVEMIIAIAVSVIVIGAATLFIRNALQNFKVATDTIDLQIEAQVLMEQLATWAMEGNEYAFLDKNNIVDGKYRVLGKGADFENAVFIIYHKPRSFSDDDEMKTHLESNGYSENLMGELWMRVIWCDGKGNLYVYMAEDVTGDPQKDVTPDKIESEWNKMEHLLSDYVEKFVVDKNSAALPNKVPITLSMKAGIHKYVLKNEINMRNDVYVSEGNSSSEREEP